MRDHFPPRHGLYDPSYERDACGMGFVADIHGRKSHSVLRDALIALTNLEHRGARHADGLSGDGAGILTQIPHAFFSKELDACKTRIDRIEDLAVGVFFLPGNPKVASKCMDIVEDVVLSGGLRWLAWRAVPVGDEALGSEARRTCPDIRQALIARPEGLDNDAYERLLYVVRRRIERRMRNAGLGPFYIPSFSHRTISYKGLMVAPQLDKFFKDLADPDFDTAIALFHQRYSTNTFPTWQLAQPFRFLAHNGEINTLQGNINRMRAREPVMFCHVWNGELEDLIPVIQEGGSDSSSFDNVFELLVLSGRNPLHAMMMLLPEAPHDLDDPEVSAFFQYHSIMVEPWDGPAGVVFSDGRYACAGLDRNGLRPSRYWVTEEGRVICGSEAGIVPTNSPVIEKGRLGPGMMLAVDTQEGRVIKDGELKRQIAHRYPYSQWINHHTRFAERAKDECARVAGPTWQPESDELVRFQKAFGYGKEDMDRLIIPMVYDRKPPVGSMGDDTPIACLSEQPQLLYRYFKQRFAQVTNPPIDPLRERLVMSLRILVGGRGSVLEEEESSARVISFPSPIITQAELDWIRSQKPRQFRSRTLKCRFLVSDGSGGLEKAIGWLCDEAERQIEKGCSIIVLSDRDVGPGWAPIPMLLAIGAVHHRLIRAGLRMKTSIICDTGEPREDHHFACLLGYGAALIHPYLALASVDQVVEKDPRKTGITRERAIHNFKDSIEQGILKIMSKMGISTVNSYRYAQVFEILGIARSVVDQYFTGTPSRIEGVTLNDIGRDVLRFHHEAYGDKAGLQEQGHYRFLGSKGGEYHSFNPAVFKLLHKSVRNQDFGAYEEYTRLVDEDRKPCNLRDLMQWEEAAQPVPLDEVEPAEEIVKRFCTQAMSHGALSRECHETLAIAMNRLGGKSNSGEGGEAVERLRPYEEDQPDLFLSPWSPRKGDWGNSAIKQVASGRFGVTPEYLVSAKELEIKMAQGAKPGEGGQIPGHKVSEEIAKIRRSVPGVTLISPPPHHDIYSIEDLAQLIHDLKQVNRQAKVCVKLVSVVGVGTVAAGVAKGYADCIQISGHDGGTGAAPLGSLKHAGLPWELGLAEAQQVLVKNDLRGRVTLRVDGGLKTGRDVVIAAMLGAEEFGFGTAAMIATGCVMARRCHLNNCPVGVATQREDLRKKYPGTPEHVVAFMLYTAEQVRMILSRLGVRSLDEIVGQVHLLKQCKRPLPKTTNISLAAILTDPDPARTKPRCCNQDRNDSPTLNSGLAQDLWRACESTIESGEPIEVQFDIQNRDRSVGARLSGEIARRHRGEGLPAGTITARFKGTAGQSFGVFNHRGVNFYLEGEAQDYVGKCMHSGMIVIAPPSDAKFASHENTIMGNTVLYGATGGSLYAAGMAGERLCVRNSGAKAVVEGCGDHGCEYMTNGVVVVLGEAGRNFGAGMSGGIAYVLDLSGDFERLYNPSMVRIGRVEHDVDELLLRAMVERHATLTSSLRAKWVLEHWQETLPKFWKVDPHPTAEDEDACEQDIKAVEQAALEELKLEAESLQLA
ncbi:Ferredoxin-dependent glutamate synthase 2 [Planctomycetes bacterium Pan216]|uniref:Glutamate synthase [NADPH] large chain n=1 Tax=Kolteria novifilia TaxID=2527975 RepID=A0A518B5K5_9BACT|nr:Ferredoxin-dependent glutamate synthase 2 [Planctomycetes bacterium Pan216]